MLAIDFRGYDRSRPGTKGNALELDILAAIDYLRDREAVDRISLAGGSMGGAAGASRHRRPRPLAGADHAQHLFKGPEGDYTLNEIVRRLLA